MSLSNFKTPSRIAVALDLYLADVRFAVSDRTDTIVEVRPSDPNKAADVKAAENTRVEYDDATRTLSIVSRKPGNQFVNFSSKRPESIDVVILLPTDSDVRGEAGLGDFQSDGELGTVVLKTGLGAVRIAEAGPLNLQRPRRDHRRECHRLSRGAQRLQRHPDRRRGRQGRRLHRQREGAGRPRHRSREHQSLQRFGVRRPRAVRHHRCQLQRRGADRRGRTRQGVCHVQEWRRRGRRPRGPRRLAGAEHHGRPCLQRARLRWRPRGRRAGRQGRGPRQHQARRRHHPPRAAIWTRSREHRDIHHRRRQLVAGLDRAYEHVVSRTDHRLIIGEARLI